MTEFGAGGIAEGIFLCSDTLGMMMNNSVLQFHQE
jgi:hypothetical protein